MKNKILLAMSFLLLLTLASCGQYDENNAKTLIRARVPKCVNITKVSVGRDGTYYAAVDSFYTIYDFSVSCRGYVKALNSKK